jgi:hypothetical protein
MGSAMIYELRIYDIAAGQMANELERMAILAYGGAPDAAGKTPGYARSLMAACGVPPMIGVWSAAAGAGLAKFFYFCRYENIADRDRVWTKFWDHPDLARAIAATTTTRTNVVEGTFPIFLRPGEAWRLVRAGGAPGGAAPGLHHELWMDRVAFGEGARAHALLGKIDLPFLCARGARVLGSFDVWIGPDIPTIVTFLAWPDPATRVAALAALDRHPESLDVRRAAQRDCRAPLFDRRETFLLDPAPYCRVEANFGAEA